MNEESEPGQGLTRPDGWQVDSIDDVGVSGVGVAGAAPTLVLDPDGTVSGSTGVNRFRGTYELAESLLEIGPLVTTRMAGSPEAMEVERHFLSVLGEPLAVRWDYSTLVLESDAGHLRLEQASDELIPEAAFDDEDAVADATGADGEASSDEDTGLQDDGAWQEAGPAPGGLAG
jgi:heat shock protein HslJ